MDKIVGYNTISAIPHVMELVESDYITCEPVGDYCVDKSHFVPKSEVVAQFRSVGDLPAEQMYDYPDGKSDDRPIPINRLHSYTGDVAEAAVAAREAAADAKSAVDKARDEYDYKVATGEIDPETGAAPAQSSAQPVAQ